MSLALSGAISRPGVTVGHTEHEKDKTFVEAVVGHRSHAHAEEEDVWPSSTATASRT